ncbi:MAG TPA: isochorismatase family cysteine hydrolase [Burkholderiaceae bacterium]|nr:isochorismatase family cysteine hydrolase [Burkholderiaceae bacterium]
MVIDMQVDFCAPGGWVDQLGEGTTSTRNAIAPIARVLTACRAAGMPVVHTREGHEPGLHDLHANKQWRTRHHGLGIGDRGRQGRILVRGEPGWQIVPELAPDAGEHIVDKPGKDAFHQTDLDAWLREHGIRHLVITGVTSDCCVQSTLREAWDRGYEGLLLSDACAAVEPRNHSGMLALLSAWGGRFGAVTDCARFLQWLGARMAQVSA